jgi:hypothetical protein
MKKFWNLMLAALVIFGAVACTENQEENIPEAKKEPVLSFVANIANDETRTYIEKNDENKWETKWDGNDTLYVEGYEFTNTPDAKDVFNCYDDGVLELIGKPVQIGNNYYGVDSTTGQAGAYLHGYQAEFDPTTTITLDVQSAFFHFTAAQEVTLKASQCIFGDKDIAEVGYVDTIKFSAGEHWVAFVPCECTLEAIIDGETVKSTKEPLDFVAKKIYNLGELAKAEPVKSEYGVVGSFQGWDVAVGKPVVMYTEGDWAVARGIELYKNDEFKIVKGNSWDVSYGLSAAGVVELDKEVSVVSSNSQNMKVAKNGKFDIYLNATAKKIKVVCVEEYTDLKVNITINNKANWSPLTVTLKDGNTVIADNATVTNNKYQVSGDYIGKTLSCQFFSGTKKSEVMNVTITKDGATVTLEETIIKLKVQLNTANSKQYWGSTMKIHVWNTGTSFDTSWPGNTMTSEGNYTWSIIVPSELVGKTIKYLVHNGNGWQSKDSTVTIKAEGNTITGSSIGIN